MNKIEINEHSVVGWKPLKENAELVPDPMILRTGEIFLNGLKGAQALGRNDIEVQNALRANVGGLLDFFDMVAARKTIPLINYTDTFAPLEAFTSIEKMLGQQVITVAINHKVYDEIKKGALINLARLNWDALSPNLQGNLFELEAFLYNWQPTLQYPALDANHRAEAEKLAALERDPSRVVIAQFLLGGLIFSGFAQASRTVHHVQPKRSRFYLGLTAAPEKVKHLTKDEEDVIFDTAEASLQGTEATVRRMTTLPPVLPYLLEEEPQPKNVQELLERAINFLDMPMGQDYRQFVEAIQGDGIKARRAEDISAAEREKALAQLSPYSHLDPEKSQSLEIGVELKEGVFLTPSIKYKLRIPVWFRTWWNDNIDFGGPRQNLRRMWMAAESYSHLSSRLVELWQSG